MTNLKTLFLALTLLVVGLHAQANDHEAAAEGSHESAEASHESNHHNTNFFPKKQADKTKASRLAQVELLEPKALSSVSGTSVTLKWKAVEGADNYRVQVATDPNFKWLVTQKDFLKETSLQVDGLQAGNHYFWRVYPWKDDNDPSWMSGFGNWSSFEVQ